MDNEAEIKSAPDNRAGGLAPLAQAEQDGTLFGGPRREPQESG